MVWPDGHIPAPSGLLAQDTPQAAKQQWRQVADQLRPELPKLSALMDEAETDVLAYMSFPAAHRTKLYSTNTKRREG